MALRSRPAFALAAALAAIVLIAVLITGALFASTQETHATRAAMLDQQAAAYAERAGLLAIAPWSCAVCDSMQVGTVFIRSAAAEPPLESTVYTTRLDSALYLVVAEGRIVVSGAARIRRRISIAVVTHRDSLGLTQASPVRGHAWAATYQM